MSNVSELAVVYAALILHDEGLEITADKLSTVIKASGVEVENIWTTLFAKALSGANLDSFISNVGSGSAAPAAAAAPAAGAAAPAAAETKKEAKKEEKKEESDEDMGFGLFD